MNIVDIDKWLYEEYGTSYTRLEELHDFLIDRNMKYQDEIERLNNELKLYKDNHDHLNNLLQQKENIIKEVREFVEKNTYDNPDTDFEIEVNTVLGNALEILDKVDKGE